MSPSDPADDAERQNRERAALQVLLVIVPEVQQHDHEQEEHHDRACVHDDLNRGQEMSLQEHERARHGTQRGDHEEKAADRALRHDDADRAADREPCEQIEENCGHYSELGSEGSQRSVLGWSCSISRSRS